MDTIGNKSAVYLQIHRSRLQGRSPKKASIVYICTWQEKDKKHCDFVCGRNT